MKTRFSPLLIICLLTVVLMLSPASCLIMMQTVTPDSKPESGMTVQYKRAKEGTFSFTVTRFLKTELQSWPGMELSDLNFESAADLEVRTGDKTADKADGKLLAKTRVAAETKDGIATYTFNLARECIRQSRFYLWESAHPKTDAQPLRTFATIYQVDLAEIDRRIEAAIPQHP